MANTTGLLGFKHIGFLPGGAPDYQLSARTIGSTNATAIFRGDPVTFSAGFIIAADAAASAKITGIFDGCTFTDSSGVTKWQPSCPAAQQATAYIINAPNAIFLAQASNTSVAVTQVNSNCGYTVGTGTTAGGGFSGYFLDSATIGTTATKPFRIIGLFSQYAPSGVNGTDNANPNNMAVVTFNQTDFKAGLIGN